MGILWMVAALVQAQVLTLFYQEVEKDGRVYVFNTLEGLQRFQQTGEMGKSITLIGVGPKGETVVGENETALDLYLFKHNLPAYQRPTPKQEPLPFSVSWKDGKTTIKTKNAELVLSNRLQVRFTDLDKENVGHTPSFRVRRFKTKWDGWAYTKDLRFELQLNWALDKPLEDANVSYDFSRGKELFVLKAGQFKVPFGRQELTSSGNLQFVDRSLVSNTYALGRDIGLQISGLAWGGKLDWRLGAFNGAGRNVTTNDNRKLQYDGRLTWQPLGAVKLTESDLAGTPKPLFALSLQGERNDRRGTASNYLSEILGGDGVLFWRGLFLFGEYFREERTPGSGPSFRTKGWNLQGGYMLVPGKLELALRYALLDPSNRRREDERLEKGVALGYFFNQHAHKLQGDIRQLENRALRQKDWEYRLQYQLIF